MIYFWNKRRRILLSYISNKAKEVIKHYIENLVYYNNKKRVIPLCLIFLIIGILSEKLVKNISINLSFGIIINIVLNSLMFSLYITDDNKNKLEKNDFFKVCFCVINVLLYSILVYLNYSCITGMFSEIEKSKIILPLELYSLIVFTAVYMFPVILIYMFIFGRIKSTKITTKGIEVEIDSSFLSYEQNKIINTSEKIIENLDNVNSQMDKIVADFILSDLVNENNEISSQYNITKLINKLISISNDNLFEGINNIVVEFKTMNNFNDILEEYNLPKNIYNRIKARIVTVNESENLTFYEGNLVFVNYKLSHLSYADLEGNRVIGIIQFKDLKEGYIGYGRLLLTMLKMLDYIITLQIIPIVEVDEDEC